MLKDIFPNSKCTLDGNTIVLRMTEEDWAHNAQVGNVGYEQLHPSSVEKDMDYKLAEGQFSYLVNYHIDFGFKYLKYEMVLRTGKVLLIGLGRL